MTYINPETVNSPKKFWDLSEVVINTGECGWSVAKGLWHEKDRPPINCLAIRWNGSNEDNGIGNPQSRGKPTWFIIPSEIESCVLEKIKQIKQTFDKFSIKIDKPDDYDYGAWKIEIKLNENVLEKCINKEFVFHLPVLKNRIFHFDTKYSSISKGERIGKFVNHLWEGNVYTNGMPEEKNPTTKEQIEKAIASNISEAIQSQCSFLND